MQVERPYSAPGVASPGARAVGVLGGVLAAPRTPARTGCHAVRGPDGRERQPAAASALRTRNGPEDLSRRRRPVRRGGALVCRRSMPTSRESQGHGFTHRAVARAGQVPSRRVGCVIVTALTPAGRSARVGAGWRTADGFTRPSRGRSHSCRHVRWSSAVLPHTRSPGGACQARRGRASFITAVCPRTLALGTYRDRRSRVGSARSLFSFQTTDAAFVLTPSGLSSGHHTTTTKRGVYYLPLTLAEGFRAVNPWLSTRSRWPVPCGGDSTVAIWRAVRERVLGGALVHS